MKIIVCLKQVPDADAPRSSYSINARENRPELSGVPPVISYYDELALEAALRVRDANGADVHITALTLGKRISKPAMQLALAAGADELVKVEDPLFHEGVLDCHAKARLLTEAVRRIGPFDLVLVGRQS